MELLNELKRYEQKDITVINHPLWLEQMKEIYVNFPDITQKDKDLLIKHDKHNEFYSKFKKRSNNFVWLTIRPRDCEPKLFKEFITKFLTAKCIDKYYCAYETKPNDIGIGLHAHIILKGDISRISSKIDYFCKATTLPKIGKTRFYPITCNQHLIQDKIDYCNGIVFAASKSEKQKENEINKNFRLKNNLLTISNMSSERYNLYLV